MTDTKLEERWPREDREFFSAGLLDWYLAHKRDLPWRRTRDPYRIWVSEIMLQQTRVDTVIPYFLRFVERFPDVTALADAPEEDVLKCWEGLGYYSRARNLQQAAKDVKERYGGVIPNDVEAVAGLKGVGPYTAGAILSIAFGRPEPAVDGNVMRVLSRFFLIDDDVAKPKTRILMEGLARELIPEGEAREFNQALMEHGAMTCTPKSPRCLVCPVMERCAGRLAGRENELPVKSKAKPPRPETRLAALVEGRGAHAGKVLIRQRPAQGLLARMWELPHWPAPEESGASERPRTGTGTRRSGLPAAPPEEAVRDRLRRSLAGAGIAARPGKHWMAAEHTFSHLQWTLQVYLCREEELPLPMAAEARVPYGAAGAAAPGEAPAGEAPEPVLPFEAGPGSSGDSGPHRWIGREEMAGYAFPNVFLKLLNAYFDQREQGETRGQEPE
ncbi:A/G-specific adenine glycosylase [Paenibacillus spiritus]|uniref:Adenine DNA glycosylase n=1 Tax=Paenibacillus spiritus TaxID=2496557 RepID=A0A5J5FUD2_9BACL|nr:A/G-specific adenine glycosylase [Paenibacillus spiritus]KAA8997162.1 A/G-specific adenine glycosylase [Paenibacillus spiritus]